MENKILLLNKQIIKRKKNLLKNPIYPFQNKKVALLFWGLARSTKWTQSSLKKNILDVLTRNKINYKIFFHTYFIKNKYTNKRAGENNIILNNDDYKIINPDYFSYDWQEDIIKDINFDNYYPKRDPWGNKFTTFKNYILAMNSQKKVSEMFLNKQNEYDYVIYIRPDVKFINELNINWFHLCKENCILTPQFGKYSGINDRFAIMKKEQVKIYGSRIDILNDKRYLTSERRLYYICKTNKINNIEINIKFQRVRATGKIEFRDNILLD